MGENLLFCLGLPTGLSIDQDKSIQKIYLTRMRNYDFVGMVLAGPIAQLKMIGFRQKRQDDRKEKKVFRSLIF